MRPPTGVNLIGYTRAEMGIGQAARALASALEAQGIPFVTVNIEQGNPSRHGDFSLVGYESTELVHDVSVLSIQPDCLKEVPLPLLREASCRRKLIGHWI